MFNISAYPTISQIYRLPKTAEIYSHFFNHQINFSIYTLEFWTVTGVLLVMFSSISLLRLDHPNNSIVQAFSTILIPVFTISLPLFYPRQFESVIVALDINIFSYSEFVVNIGIIILLSILSILIIFLLLYILIRIIRRLYILIKLI